MDYEDHSFQRATGDSITGKSPSVEQIGHITISTREFNNRDVPFPLQRVLVRSGCSSISETDTLIYFRSSGKFKPGLVAKCHRTLLCDCSEMS